MKFTYITILCSLVFSSMTTIDIVPFSDDVDCVDTPTQVYYGQAVVNCTEVNAVENGNFSNGNQGWTFSPPFISASQAVGDNVTGSSQQMLSGLTNTANPGTSRLALEIAWNSPNANPVASTMEISLAGKVLGVFTTTGPSPGPGVFTPAGGVSANTNIFPESPDNGNLIFRRMELTFSNNSLPDMGALELDVNAGLDNIFVDNIEVLVCQNVAMPDPNPACLSTDPILWLRADEGVVANAGQVTSWMDVSPTGNDAISDGTAVSYATAGNVMNFNPAIRFDNGVDANGRLIGEDSLGLVTANGDLNDFTFFIVPVIKDPEGGECGEDVFNFFNSESLLEVENFVPKNGCEQFTNSFTYGVFNGGEYSFNAIDNEVNSIIALDFDGGAATAALSAFGNGTDTTVNQVNPYIDPLVDMNNPYSVGQSVINQATGDQVATADIGEVIIFPGVLSQLQREQVTTYLAIKYGVTLLQSYVGASGTTLWDPNDAVYGPFSFAIAGIGRLDCNNFEQRQSRASRDRSIVTIGVGEIAENNLTNPNSAPQDSSYLLWGNSAERVQFTGMGGTADFDNRYSRTWKVAEYRGGVVADAYQDLDVAFNRDEAELDGPDATYVLLVDRDGDGNFSNADEFTGGTTNATGDLVFEGVDLDHGDCFTLARPSCDLDIMSIIADCQNGNEFDITVNLDYTYNYNSAGTPGTINIRFNDQTFTSDPLTAVTGSTSVSFTIDGSFPSASVVARFSTDDLCLDSENLNLINCDLACVAQPDAISGHAYPDYNGNGIRDVGEGGVPDAIVNIYDCDGNLAATQTTGADGLYQLDGLDPGTTYRVEYVPPPGLLIAATYVDADNPVTASAVRFLPAGSCNQNIGAITPDFCFPETTQYVTSCFTKLNPAQNPGADVIISFLASGGANGSDEAAYSQPPEHPIDVGVGEVGPISGLAYDRGRQLLYAAATVKGETFFPAGRGIDDVYVIDNSTNDPNVSGSVNSATSLISLADCGIDLGNYVTDFDIPGGLDDGVDDSIFVDVGKIGLGDIDLNFDGTILFATNLKERTLVVIPLLNGTASCGTVSEVAIPEPASCVGKGVVRPWAIGRRTGDPSIYVGAVCDASISQDIDDLRAFVFRFDPTANTFDPTPVLDIAMGYPRQTNFAEEMESEWLPWVENVSDAPPLARSRYCCGNTYFLMYPQPILSDIEFDRGDMILGFTDRFANQLGQIPANSTKSFSAGSDFVIPAGDILRAGINADLATWTLESGGSTNGVIAGMLNTAGPNDMVNQGSGPGGREFYWEDDYRVTADHFETSVGGLAHIPGQPLAVNAFDPIRNASGAYGTGGVNFLSNDNGSWLKGYGLYGGVVPGSPGNFGKGAGFGDLEPVCAIIKQQIGNYVFVDNDADGIQDGCDLPLEGVAVSLYDAITGDLRATTVTNARGEYYFSGASSDTENWVGAQDSLGTGDEVIIVFGFDGNNPANNNYDPTTDALSVNGLDYQLTLVDQPAPMGDSDRSDSDADTTLATGQVWNGYPFITYTVGEEQTDFSLDAGFIPQTLDLALIKTTDQTDFVVRNDMVIFTITVVNQGSKPVDTVSLIDYAGNGFNFDPTDNTGAAITVNGVQVGVADWMNAGPDAAVQLTFGTGGLKTADTARIDILQEIVSPDPIIGERFVNRAEISRVIDLQGDDVSGEDIDSSPDTMIGNDPGGRVLTGADDAFNGDGMGPVNGIFAATDEDDADPALVPVFDLAINKIVNVGSLGPDSLAGFGEVVEFFITVSNQGNSPARNIEVFDAIPCGYSAENPGGGLLAANAGWSGSDAAGLNFTFTNLLLPGQSVRKSLFLQLETAGNIATNCPIGEDPFINRVEIAEAQDSDGNPQTGDFDSNYDITDDAEDGGGVVNSATDNVVDGNGTGVQGSDDPLTDDDDMDVADICVIDVALIKTLDETFNDGPFAFGETAKFDIELFSQGNVAVDTFDVIDYLPVGLEYNATLNDPLGWDYDPVSRTARLDGIPANDLALGQSITVSIYLDVLPTSSLDEDFVNVAEITRFHIDPSPNPNLPGFAQLVPGYLMQDADSSQDDDPDNDPGGEVNTPDDDNIAGGGLAAGEDEDDSDPAGLMVINSVVVGDTVFIDVDMNDLQSNGDLPIEGVTVTIFNADGSPVDEDNFGNPYDNEVMTDPQGAYLFDSLPPGNYYVVVDPSTATQVNPDLYVFVTPNVGGNDGIDSDVDANGQSDTTGVIMAGDTVFTLDAGLVCQVIAEAGTAQTICGTQTVDLTSVGASITPVFLGGNWTTSGDGTFDAQGAFGIADTYTPGAQDISDGTVTLTLTTNFPQFPSGCEPDMDTVIITILNVDCGSFPWEGE